MKPLRLLRITDRASWLLPQQFPVALRNLRAGLSDIGAFLTGGLLTFPLELWRGQGSRLGLGTRGNWRLGVLQPVGLGIAELVPDPGRPAGWTLLIDEVAQSYVDLDDPTHLEFEYVRRVAALIDVMRPAGQPMRVLHLGGGALTLPRYVAATRPGSEQWVIERDAVLAALVRRVLPVPGESAIEVVIADARDVLSKDHRDDRRIPSEFDLVVADVYRGARLAPGIATTTFADEVVERLGPGGLYVVNVTDLPPLTFSRRQAATLRSSFADVCVIGEPGMLRGRRFGNVVFAAAPARDALPIPRLAVAVARDRRDGRVLHGATLDQFIGGALPMREPLDEAACPITGPET
jgi:spermidine synthase